MQVTISLHAQRKINGLSSKASKKFLRIIYNLIHRQLASHQVKELEGERKLLRIRYNRGDRIIATVLKNPPEPQLRILDFVSHTIMDQDRYFRNLEGNYEILDLEEKHWQTELDDTDNFTPLTIFDNSSELASILTNSSQELYFYLYNLANDPKANPDISLSPQQYELVKIYLPQLLAGSAGSGKTTIALYHGIKTASEQPDKQIIYVTYNSRLKDYAEKLVTEIYNLKQVPNLKIFDYYSLGKTLGLSDGQFPPEKQINQHNFTRKFCQTRSNLKSIDPIFLWQEIRHSLKGSSEAYQTNNGLIPQELYLQQKSERQWSKELTYQIAENYQAWLKHQGLWDELDLTHHLLELNIKGQYDYLYCDEVQDLTAIQVHLLLQLLRPPIEQYTSFPKFLFTGDTAQIINPSGFSWHKVKQVIYHNYGNFPTWCDIHKNFDKPLRLTINFRSTKPIVELANKILGKSRIDSWEQSSFREGEKLPILITKVTDTDILNQKTTFGPSSAIITVNQEDKDKLIKQFSQDGIESRRVLTVSEAKGLEYSEVLVWNFFSKFESWQAKDLQELEAYKYNCLYVCATRARDNLYFYESTNSSFWQQPELKDYIVISENKLDLENFFNPDITSTDWKESALNLEKQGAYLQAKENYLRGGWKEDAERMEAEYQIEQGDLNKAATIYLQQGNVVRAIQLLEEIHNYQQIAEIWEKQENYLLAASAWEKVPNYAKAASVYEQLQQWKNAERCWEELPNWERVAIAAENQNEPEKWYKAAKIWEQNSEIAKAAYCYQHTTAWEEAEKCWRDLNDWEKVAIACEHQQKWLDVAQAYKRVNQIHKAAEACERGEYWLEAAQYWQEVSNTYRVALMYQRCAGKSWETLGEAEKAAQAYDYGEYWHKAEELYELSSQLPQLAKVYEKQEKWVEAAQLWQELSKWNNAAQNWKNAQKIEKAAVCYQVAEDWINVVKLRLQLTQWSKVAEAYEHLQEWQSAAQMWEKAGDINNALQCYQKGEIWSEVERCFKLLKDWVNLAMLFEKQERWKEAASVWEELREWRKSAVNYQKLGELYKAGDLFERGNCLEEAKSCWEELGESEKVARICEAQQRYCEAAKAREDIKQYQKAALLYEKASSWSDAERCWRALKDWEKMAIACERQNRQPKSLMAAQIWLKLAEDSQDRAFLIKAAEAYQRSLRQHS